MDRAGITYDIFDNFNYQTEKKEVILIEKACSTIKAANDRNPGYDPKISNQKISWQEHLSQNTMTCSLLVLNPICIVEWWIKWLIPTDLLVNKFHDW